MIATAAFILICVCVILLAATGPNPRNWVVCALAVLALLLAVFGHLNISVGGR